MRLRPMRSLFIPVSLALAVLSGCAMGPNYRRPQFPLPDQFRGAPLPNVPNVPNTPNAPGAISLADTKWQDLFHDQTLNQIVTTALEKNFDLQIAAERVQQARAQLGITRANQYPFLDVQAGFAATHPSSFGANRFVPPGTDLSVAYTRLGAALSWELDVWGRLRRLTEAARAQYLASQEGRSAVTVSLISEVMSSYLQLLEQDLELDISHRTGGLALDSVRLVGLRRQAGAASGLDLRQAEQLQFTAAAQVAAAERNIAQTE